MEERFRTFTTQITKVSRLVRKIKTEEMSEFDLKSGHVSCLYYLYKQNALTSKQLCDICKEDKASISRSMDYLTKEGYVYCKGQSGKRYRCPFYLTEKGKEVGAHIVEKIDRILSQTNEGLTDEQLRDFYRALAMISNNLEKICESYDDSDKD